MKYSKRLIDSQLLKWKDATKQNIGLGKDNEEVAQSVEIMYTLGMLVGVLAVAFLLKRS